MRLLYFAQIKTEHGKVKRLKALATCVVLVSSFVNYSCESNCSNDGKPDLKLSSQDFPSSASVNQTFQLKFTVVNNSTDQCAAQTTSPSQVNLKMVKRETGVVQVNDFENLDRLSDKQSQLFTFNVIIGPDPGPGIYDLTFTIDPDRRSNDAVPENNVFTSVVTIN